MPWDSIDKWRDEDGVGRRGALSNPVLARLEARGIDLEKSTLMLMAEVRIKPPPRLMASLRDIRGPEPEGWRENTTGAKLAERKAGVLALIAEGCSDPEIASELGVPVGTVQWDVKGLLRMFGARNRTHLCVIAIQRGALTFRNAA